VSSQRRGAEGDEKSAVWNPKFQLNSSQIPVKFQSKAQCQPFFPRTCSGNSGAALCRRCLVALCRFALLSVLQRRESGKRGAWWALGDIWPVVPLHPHTHARTHGDTHAHTHTHTLPALRLLDLPFHNLHLVVQRHKKENGPSSPLSLSSAALLLRSSRKRRRVREIERE